MHVLIVNNSVIPALRYGGTERVIWYLGKELVKMGHRVSYLVAKGSQCDFGDVYVLDDTRPVIRQLPGGIDVVHFNNNPPEEPVDIPYIVTIHGNSSTDVEFDVNTVFVSKDHAWRYGSSSFVYNGLDWDDYGDPGLGSVRDYFHFLGHAAWRVKNVKGAIDVVTSVPNEKLAVLGGTRLNVKMGFRFTWSPCVKFYGMVGGEEKLSLLRGSKGLVFPVRWNEPFGLALTESLYFGCPVLGTPYGSLPEIVREDVGFLSNKAHELAEAVKNIGSYSRVRCHEYARDMFNSKIMAMAYLDKYNEVLSGKSLNAAPPKLKQRPTEKFLPWESFMSGNRTVPLTINSLSKNLLCREIPLCS
jgi:glycosyltransferase involved in cell wall biosynthesis